MTNTIFIGSYFTTLFDTLCKYIHPFLAISKPHNKYVIVYFLLKISIYEEKGTEDARQFSSASVIKLT